MKMVIETYQQRVGPEQDPIIPEWKKVHKDFERRSVVSYNERGGYPTPKAFYKKIRRQRGFQGFIRHKGTWAAKINEPSYFGIKSYQLVYLK